MKEDFLEQEISVFGLRSKIKDLDPRYWKFETIRSAQSFGTEVRGIFSPTKEESFFISFIAQDIAVPTNKRVADKIGYEITSLIKDKLNSKKMDSIGEYEQRIYDLERTLYEHEKADARISLNTDNETARYALAEEVDRLQQELYKYHLFIRSNEALYDQIAKNNKEDKYKLVIKKFRETRLNNVIDFNKILKKFGINREAV